MSNSSTGGQGILEQIWDLRDQRVDEWPLMSSPLPTVALCGLYFYTVKFMGPRFMKERKPYDLKNTIIVYNLVQVAFSAWLLFKIFFAGWGTTYRDEKGVNFLATLREAQRFQAKYDVEYFWTQSLTRNHLE